MSLIITPKNYNKLYSKHYHNNAQYIHSNIINPRLCQVLLHFRAAFQTATSHSSGVLWLRLIASTIYDPKFLTHNNPTQTYIQIFILPPAITEIYIWKTFRIRCYPSDQIQLQTKHDEIHAQSEYVRTPFGDSPKAFEFIFAIIVRGAKIQRPNSVRGYS